MVAVTLANGLIAFTPTPNFDGLSGFDYTVSDGTDGTSVGHVEVNVVSTNIAPVAVIDIIDAVEDEAITINIADLLANDSDPDNEPFELLSIEESVIGANAFVLPGGRVQFVPDENVNGVINFEYVITDGRLQGTGIIELNFAAVNDGPIANGDGIYTGDEDTPLVIQLSSLLENDRDVEGDAFFVESVFDGNNGTVVIVDDNAVFTPRADYFGNAGFTYSVVDARGAANTGFVSITILPADDLPIPVSDTGFEVFEDSVLKIDPADLLANDYDPDDPGGSQLIFLSTLTDGKFHVEPAPDYFGELIVSYALTDASGIPVYSTVTIDVLPVSDDPVAFDDTLETVEDTPLIIFASQLLANDIDVDLQAVLFNGVIASNGVTVTSDGFGRLNITPVADRIGLATFDYEIVDSTGITDTARVTITIAGVNDAPVIGDIPSLVGDEDQAFSATFPSEIFTDVDFDQLLIGLRGRDDAELPSWLTFDFATLTLVGTPPADFNGEIELELTAFDGTLETVKPVTLTIQAINDAPVASNDSWNAGTDILISIPVAHLTANDFDIDGDALEILSVTGGSGVSAALDGAGNLVVDRDPALSGQITVNYRLSDGQFFDDAEVVIDVLAVNRVPEIGQIDPLHAIEDQLISLTLPANIVSDPDGDNLTLRVARAGGTALPAWLAFDAGSLNLLGTPPSDFHGNLALELTADDGQLSATRAFDLFIDPVNDAPKLSAPYSDRFITEDEVFTLALQTGLASDVDGDPLIFDVRLEDGSALPGWLAFDAAAFALTGTPPQDFNGEISLRIFISDGAAEISDDFGLTVTPINDAPLLANPIDDYLISDDGSALLSGRPFSITIPENSFSDTDGDALGFAARLGDGAGLPEWLEFDGLTFSGTAPHGAVGIHQIELLASDGQLQNSDIFNLTFGHGNYSPIAVDDGPYETRGNVPLSFSPELLLSNDTDADGDALQISGVSTAEHGTLNSDNNQIIYTPETGFVGNDQFFYEISDGRDTSSAAVSVVVGEPFDNTIIGSDEVDVIIARGNEDNNIDAGLGNDRVISGGGNDFLSGEAGNDLLFSGAGDDVIIGGSGRDRAFGGFGQDNISGGAGNDRLFGGRGRDTIDGGEGRDRIYGGLGADKISGGAGYDWLYGGRGRDEISGGVGDDKLFGGQGADVFIFGEGDGVDQIMDFEAPRSGRRFNFEGDTIKLSIDGVNNFDQLLALAQDQEGGVLFDFGDGDELFLAGTQLSALDKDSFTFF